MTSLGGELIDVVTSQTVLAGSLPREWPARSIRLDRRGRARDRSDPASGARCSACGCSQQRVTSTADERLAYLMGAAIGNVMDTLLARRSFRPGTRVLVTGHPALAHAFAEQLRGTRSTRFRSTTPRSRTRSAPACCRCSRAAHSHRPVRAADILPDISTLPAAAEDLNMFNRAVQQSSSRTLAAVVAAGITVRRATTPRPPPLPRPPAPAGGAFPVAIRVDASKSTGPLKPIWRFFGADEPNYAYMKDGQKLIADLGALAPKRVYLPRAQPARHRRRHARAEVGIDQRLSRGRAGQADLRLDDRRSHLRHLSRARREAVRADRLHAGSAVDQAASRTSTRGRRRRSTTRSTPAGPIRRRTSRSGATWSTQWAKHCVEKYGKAEVETLVLGNLERSQHRLLARHAGGVPQAARLRDRRRAPRAAHGARRRAGHRGPRRPVRARFLRASAARHELRHRQDRHADRFRVVPRQGPAGVRRRPRAAGHRESAARRSTRASGSSRRSPS